MVGDALLCAHVLYSHFSLSRLLTNKLLLKKQSRDPIEWGYCFDVHLNSFVPLSLFVFGLQMVLIRGITTTTVTTTTF